MNEVQMALGDTETRKSRAPATRQGDDRSITYGDFMLKRSPRKEESITSGPFGTSIVEVLQRSPSLLLVLTQRFFLFVPRYIRAARTSVDRPSRG
jgi:hypothetical protein